MKKISSEAATEAERGKEKSKRANRGPQKTKIFGERGERSDRARPFLEKEGEGGGSIYRSRSQPNHLMVIYV